MEIFIQKLNINGLHRDIQNINERQNYYIQKVEYIVNLDEFRQGYGKNHKRSLNQKVVLFIFIIEYFINSWQN